MNRRQRKKLDKKLWIAIRELNNDIRREEGEPFITEREIADTLQKVKASKRSIRRTLADYKKYVLHK